MKNSECSLFGRFGWFVQGLLFAVCALPVIWKWWNERPRRSLVTFVIDSSKQVNGNVTVHFINLALSAFLAKKVHKIDKCGDQQCLWYFVFFVLDFLIVLPLNYFFLVALKYIAERRSWTLIQDFGHYGETFSFARFFAQTVAWVGVVLAGKAILCAIIFVEPYALLHASAAVLGAVRCKKDSAEAELVVVMLLVPVVLNVLQFWITDNIIKFHRSEASQRSEKEETPLLKS